ncbi:lipoxygenase family protein [Candidatus Methylospira mobilis]|uniref:lipoxygenase family protein n=1 Tax=Candidatus Methylospira mobilis TaxID=1808979 RepID=UPI0028E1AD33|nr:lipoxygenase family protein [Candidatus Methylospira mobilis]WNV04665.1 lipoxygenase family protein [Candidatus Methylospira mobilis]
MNAIRSQNVITNYVYQFNASDLAYSTDQYPVAGNFSATTTPWLNDKNTIPKSWQFTPDDDRLKNERMAQIVKEAAYINKNVPGQTYVGPATEQIRQRYTWNMWDTTVFTQKQIDTLTGYWIDDDAEFARQRLGGANPNVIAKYNGRDDGLDQFVNTSAGAHNKNALIAALRAAHGRNGLFICDYRPVLGNVQTRRFVREGSYFSVPVAFFSVEGNELMPLAIQIDSINNAYIFTPHDDANSWLLAKLWVGYADFHWWYGGTHLFNTHSIVMIFSIAALNLIEQDPSAETHPLMVLMTPHLKKVCIRTSGVYDVTATDPIPGLYHKGKFCDRFFPTGRIGIYQIINNLYQNYSFDAMAFPQTLANRQIDSASLPVSFPYRDDGQIWWQAIQQFVGNVVDATYADDAAVVKDPLPNAWMNMAQGAFNRDGVKRYTWVASKNYLKHALTNLFFTATAQHTAVNNSMFQSWGFLPNGVFAMEKAPPQKPGVSDEELLGSLPNPQEVTGRNLIANQIGTVMEPTTQVNDVVTGDGTAASLHDLYPYDQIRHPKQYQAVSDFYSALWTDNASVNAQITENQRQRIAAFMQTHDYAKYAPNSVSYYYLSVTTRPDMGINASVMNCIQV